MEENQEDIKVSWTEEFAPKTIDDMVLSSELKEEFRNVVRSRTAFGYLFSGRPGIGKTSIAKVLANEMNASVLFVQCGIDGTVAYAQSTVQNFCNSLSFDGRPKMVIMDEIDCASGTQDNSFQKTMRNIISDSKDVIFIGTCNYPEKVIAPLRDSRLGVKEMKFSSRELFDRVKMILDRKGVSFDGDSLKKFVSLVFKKHYPDVRRIISDLQKCCASGTLVVSDGIVGFDDSFVRELVEKCSSYRDVLALRQFYISNKSKIEDYLTFSSEVFNFVVDNGLVRDGDSVLKLSNMMYQMNLVIDREVQFFAMMTFLSKCLGGRK